MIAYLSGHLPIYTYIEISRFLFFFSSQHHVFLQQITFSKS